MSDRRHTFSVREIGREIALIAMAALVYFGVRGLTQGRVDHAFDNAHRLLRLERELGIAWEQGLQSLILDHRWLLTATNWVYVYGHWPVIIGSGIALYVWRPDRYVLLRNAMFISGLLGFAFFAGFPVAPPRFSDPGLVDTITRYSEGYRALQPPDLTNKYAAFPSLHAGWNLLVGIVLFQATTHRAVRAFAFAMPVAMAFAVVATANHYVLDVVGGTVLVLIGYAIARSLNARTMRRTRERSEARSGPFVSPPIRHRAPVRQLAARVPDSGGARGQCDRGGRPPVSRAPRAAPSEDARADPDPVGSLDARKSASCPARRR
ncbi:MAG TPA: phosphatase PAP2 family protein [Gaiellaceae bacterium]|nr:phosphatase PAP2 family protein [Gaiellaceae bacterium]